jgi:hypothetical protein
MPKKQFLPGEFEHPLEEPALKHASITFVNGNGALRYFTLLYSKCHGLYSMRAS